jgi:hypothetical protein
VQLTRSFTAHQFARALESWSWTGITELRPAFTSSFGYVFLQNADGLWFLDLIEGKLTRRWAGRDALKADLNSPEGQDRYLLAGLAFAAERVGIVASNTQVLSFKVPPVLGGATAVENVEAADFVVSVNLAGQIHQQIQSLPPGTPISGFTLSTD